MDELFAGFAGFEVHDPKITVCNNILPPLEELRNCTTTKRHDNCAICCDSNINKFWIANIDNGYESASVLSGHGRAVSDKWNAYTYMGGGRYIHGNGGCGIVRF
jgi:hypothetical protein